MFKTILGSLCDKTTLDFPCNLFIIYSCIKMNKSESKIDHISDFLGLHL